MQLVSLATAILLASSVAACGSGPYCGRTSKCHEQPARTDTQKKACTDDLAKAGACGTEYESWLNCQADREICAADGTSDPVATFAYASKPCQPAKDAYDACVGRTTDAGK